jgi:pyruvate dehydrogenase E1 component beta subunit
MTYSKALRAALSEEMRRDKTVFLMGEDIGVYGGAFGVTRGLIDDFGPDRVMDTPISEGGFVGVATGAALAGSRPVVEIMFMDFITLALDALVNMASKLHYVFGKQARCPLVVRTPAGGGRSYGPTHSQSLEGLLLHVPGLKLAAPSTPADAYRLMKTAIRDDNPVVMVEHKRLYGESGPVNGKAHLPFGRARMVRKGSDMTIVAWSWMSVEAERAGADLQDAGVNAEIIDLRTLNPIDEDTLMTSVKKTGRVLIVEEGCRTGGVASEIGTRIFEAAYDYLDAPIRRLASADVPVPSSPALERAMLPSRTDIVQAALTLISEDD